MLSGMVPTALPAGESLPGEKIDVMPAEPHVTDGAGYWLLQAHGSLRVLLQCAQRGPWSESKRSCHAPHWSGGRWALFPVHGAPAAETARAAKKSALRRSVKAAEHGPFAILRPGVRQHITSVRW